MHLALPNWQHTVGRLNAQMATYAVFETEAACGTGSCSAASFLLSDVRLSANDPDGPSLAGRKSSSSLPKSVASFTAALSFGFWSLFSAVVEKQWMVDTKLRKKLKE